MLDEYARYIAQNSSNVRELAEAMKFDLTEADKKIDLQNKTLDLTQDRETLKIFIESDMKKELDDLFKGMMF